MERLLSPRDVATAIGVSESSLKRWADEGLLNVTRTVGGHRRIALREVLRYIRQTGTPVLRPEVLGLPAAPAEAAAGGAVKDQDAFLVESILRGDAVSARSILLSRFLAGESFADLCDGPLREALHRIGELWHHGPEGIHREHRSVDVCVHAINHVRALLPDPAPDAMVALGGAPAGDPYFVPSLMVATVLAAEGWRDINLGANVPVVALTSAMRGFAPRLVWMSFSSGRATDAALRELGPAVELAEEIGTSFVIGGQCAPARTPFPARAVQILPSMQALAAFSRGLSASRIRSIGENPEVGDVG